MADAAIDSSPHRDTPAGRSRLVPILAWVIAALILLQAALAGSGQFLGAQVMELHGWIGAAVFMLAALLLMVAFFGRHVGAAVFCSLLILLGTFAQIGLGYMGRRAGLGVASAVHIPIGVLLFGLAVAVAIIVMLRPRAGQNT